MRGVKRNLRHGARAALFALAAFGFGMTPGSLASQTSEVAGSVGGAVLGAATGVYTTLAINVTKARTGSYIYSMGELVAIRPETLPILLGPLAGLAVGAAAPDRLGRGALWGGAGFLAGAALGATVGTLVGDTSEERWAGAIIGSAAGLVTGLIAGSLSGGDRSEPTFSIGVPLRLGGP